MSATPIVHTHPHMSDTGAPWVELQLSGQAAVDLAARLLRMLQANPRGLDRIYAAARDYYQTDAAKAVLAAHLLDLTVQVDLDQADDLSDALRNAVIDLDTGQVPA